MANALAVAQPGDTVTLNIVSLPGNLDEWTLGKHLKQRYQHITIFIQHDGYLEKV